MSARRLPAALIGTLVALFGLQATEALLPHVHPCAQRGILALSSLADPADHADARCLACALHVPAAAPASATGQLGVAHANDSDLAPPAPADAGPALREARSRAPPQLG